jgi:hypothetical protein
MELSKLMVNTKSAWVKYPGLSGLEVEFVNLSRPELTSLRKKCTVTKFDRKTRKPVEDLDEDMFIEEFTLKTIKNWKGMKLKYLEHFILVDLGDADPESELEFTTENAVLLVKNSADFDGWVNDVVFDLENFRTRTD